MLGICEEFKIVEVGNVVYCDNLSWRERVFKDRFNGGKVLAKFLTNTIPDILKGKTAIFALVAGGVPVTYALSKTLKKQFDILVVKKITYPWTTEAGFGAVAPDGTYVYDKFVARNYLGYSEEDVNHLAKEVKEYVVNRTLKLRGSLEYPNLKDYVVVIVDDGIATGYTMVVATRFLRKKNASKIIVASPTASNTGLRLVSKEADKVVVVNVRSSPYAVADAYLEWHDVNDEEVLEILIEAEKNNLYPPPWRAHRNI